MEITNEKNICYYIVMLNELIQNILNRINNVKTNDDIQYVNKYIKLVVSDTYFYNKIQYLISDKGKRIRSKLALYYYYKYSNDKSYSIKELHKILAIVEITHFASLLHDDVIDNSFSRRCEKSFNCLYGNKNSILIGDYLLISVFNHLLQILNNKNYCQYMIKQFIKSSTDTAYGAYLEINNNYLEKYIKIARLKTGSLFKFSGISGCILSNASFNTVKQAANFGTLFGIIYQIQNDLDDYKYNNYNESEDYMQSNITFPIIILQKINKIDSLFNNKNQINFDKIKQLINTNEFTYMFFQVVNNYVDKINLYI